MKKVVVIGSGFAGLSAATFLARAGYAVTVVEKFAIPGGRARQFTSEGFTFDMGPSWYWMPDVFERYFNGFGKKTSDYYQLERLDPSYKVFWKDGGLDIPADLQQLSALFEEIETGSAKKLQAFLEEAAFKYETGINKLVFKPGRSWLEFADIDLARGVLKLDVFTSMKKHISRYFTNPRLVQLMEFPVLFLGALPQNIPALYSLMNYADIQLGTWYPHGGMYSVVDGMYRLALEQGVKFKFETDVFDIVLEGNRAVGVKSKDKEGDQFLEADVVVGAADYHFIESVLLPASHRSYSEMYWDKRVMAPSCLIYYVGLNRKVPGITHHSLFFDTDFDRHGNEIYSDPQWPADPLFYVCAPSVSDESVAPPGGENLFFLVPVAAGLQGDTEELRGIFFEKILMRFEKHLDCTIKDNIIFKRSYAVSDFVHDYNAYKGNAYGLANTLMQTAVLKPSLKSKKVENLFFTGQLTVPGPGVPPSLISGEVVAGEILKEYK